MSTRTKGIYMQFLLVSNIKRVQKCPQEKCTRLLKLPPGLGNADLSGKKGNVNWLCFDFVDIPVYPESLLPLPRGAAGNALWPGHRHVVPGLHLGRDAHWRASLQWSQWGKKEQRTSPACFCNINQKWSCLIDTDSWLPFIWFMEDKTCHIGFKGKEVEFTNLKHIIQDSLAKPWILSAAYLATFPSQNISAPKSS